MNKLLRISDVCKIVKLLDPKTKKPLNYILRYWEKEFKVLKPKKINNQRYYSSKQIEIVKTIKFLLKNKGMTLAGVKKMMNLKINHLDEYNNHSLKVNFYKELLRTKSKTLLEKLNRLKSYGKKNSS